MKWITQNFMALSFLAAAMYLFSHDSHNWGWLVFCSLITSVTSPHKDEEKKTEPKKEEADFIREIEKRVNERNN
jgi:hypothetical protein